MIITNICLLLEVLSFVICLHQLYGKKLKLDIETVSLLAIDMIVMQIIDFLGLPSAASVLMYFLIVVYCGVKFGFKIKEMIANIILCIILVGGIQMLGMLSGFYLFGMQDFSNYKLLFVNCMTFLVVLFVLPLFKVSRLSRFSQDNSRIIIVVISVCLVWVLVCMLSFKNANSMELRQEIMLFANIFLILVLAEQLSKYKVKAKEVEMELEMHQVYSEPFQRLVDNIRLRQHEFDNHINAIYSQHFSYHTYEELVEAQKSYCEHITKDNRFNKLLAQDNSVIRGFLYTRFLEINDMGIEISYQVSINEFNIGVPIYKIIEILGDLLNNAVEALAADEERNRLHVSIIETDTFFIEVKNESPYIEYDSLGKFFDKGYSKKGENRGLGLYNIKQICEEYGLEVAPECREEDGRSWLAFKIWKEK